MTKNLITRKVQFLFLIGAILLAPSIARASAVTASVDSLQNLLQNDTDAGQRAIIYIHLADIHVDSLNISSQYWDKALTEAAKAKGKVYNLRPTISAGRTQHPFPVLLVLLQHLGGNAKEQFAGNNRTGTGQAEKGKSRTNDT